MIDKLMWAVSVFSLIGTILVTNRHRRGFLFWIGTNAAWVAYDIHKGAFPQAALMAVYFGLAVYGFYKWRPATENTENSEEG